MRRRYVSLPSNLLPFLKATFALCLSWSVLQCRSVTIFLSADSTWLDSLDSPFYSTVLSRDRPEGLISVWQQATAHPCYQHKARVESFVIPEKPDQSVPPLLLRSLHDLPSSHNVCASPTSQVRIFVKCPHWELQALDVNGSAKQKGGDEFYVTYTDHAHRHRHTPINGSDVVTTRTHLRRTHPTAIAQLTDLANGRYILNFTSSPLNHRDHRLEGYGIITVFFQYTCGIGRMAPPRKGHWKSGGSTVVEHSRAIAVVPPISPFVPVLLPLDARDDDLGGNRTKQIKNSPKLTTSPFFMGFGDSLMQHFMKPLKHVELPNIGMPLNTTTVDDWIQLFRRRMDSKLRLLIQSLATIDSVGKAKVVLIVGSSTWDILEPQDRGFSDHKAALEKLLAYFHDTYPEVRVVWKSPTALHIHVPMIESNSRLPALDSTTMHNRLKYMSSSRSHELYQLQLEVCKALGIPFLDVYEASYLSADHTLIGDGRHYSDDFNAMTMTWFLQNSPVEDLWNRYYNRDSQKSSRILVGKHCDSWVDVVNVVVVAMVTNRRLIWQPVTECRIISSSPFSQNRNQAEAIAGQASKGTRTLDQRLPFPLSLDVLIREGWISKDVASTSNRLARDMFDEGSPFLNGMILSTLLDLSSQPDVSFTQEPFPPDASLVFAVHDPNMNSDIRDCMVTLKKAAADAHGLAILERLSCQVIFHSTAAVDKWKQILKNDFNCSATAVLDNEPNYPVEDEHWFHAIPVATKAHDGYISSCNSPSDGLFQSLVQYIRTKGARGRGNALPDTLERCCLKPHSTDRL
eukprot:scaffold22560_cov135-Cylindrotheca_fusiformis.AAC.14